MAALIVPCRAKRVLIKLLLGLIFTAVSVRVSAQATNYAQVNVLVIPFVKIGEDFRTRLVSDLSLRELIGKIKNSVEQKGFTVKDYETTLKEAADRQIFKQVNAADIKKAFIEYSATDIYIEVEINATRGSTGGTTVKVLLTAYDAATSAQYTSIICNSRERMDVDNGTLANVAISIPVPPMQFTDDDRRSKLPCLDDFLNNLQAKLSPTVIAGMVEKRKARLNEADNKNCELAMARAEHEMMLRNYEGARTILTAVPQENTGCFTTAQQKIELSYSQQCGSLDKAGVFYQKQVILDPENEASRKNLAMIKKLIAIRNEQDKTPPRIELITPETNNGDNIKADISGKGIYVSGNAKSSSGISTVNINGMPVAAIKDDGFFNMYIDKKASDIKIDVKDKKGNTTSRTLHIASRSGDTQQQADDIPLIDNNETFHAIFIANGNYSQGFDPLPTVVNEEKKIMKMLVDKYNFDPANIDTLFNKSSKDMIGLLIETLPKLTDKDNLVIYYGGHGYYDPAENMAYWVPLNASGKQQYISNTAINALLADCKAHHILIMSDACFSGGFRGGEDAPSKYEYKLNSRQMLASGGIEKVPSASAYVKHVLNVLSINTDKYISASTLQSLIAPGIKSDAQTECRIISLNVPGNANGQFYFKLK